MSWGQLSCVSTNNRGTPALHPNPLDAFALRNCAVYVIPTLHSSWEESYPAPPIRIIVQKEGLMRPLPPDETEFSILWKWYVRYALINLIIWLLIIGLLLLFAFFTQEVTPLAEQ
jgi:hypothetical protein